MRRKILAGAAAALLMCACGNASDSAARLADECEKLYESKEYDAALVLVDSLRRTYPGEAAARRKALEIYQKAELAKAQAGVLAADSALRQAAGALREADSVVARHKADGTVTADELTRQTRLRMRRDTLQTLFDVQCAKIRYIKQKMKE